MPFGGYMTLRWNITKETIKQNCSRFFFILKPLLHQSNSIIQLEILLFTKVLKPPLPLRERDNDIMKIA